jgi:hypothetical protein
LRGGIDSIIRKEITGISSMILSNPITIKELRTRMRGIRAILPIMAYLVVLAVFLLLAFDDFGETIVFSDLSLKGRALGFTLLRVQVILVLLLGPAYAAGAIAIEKERETFGVMQATLLTPLEIVAGKVFTGFSYATLLVLSSLPLLSLVFWMGGFDFVHLFWGFLIIASAAFLINCTGILVSTVFSRSYMATGATYATILVAVGLSYLVLAIANWWHNIYQTGYGFSIMTVPVWFAYTLSPFMMLDSLDQGAVNYSSAMGYYKNPIIDFLSHMIAFYHLPYVAMNIILSVCLGIVFLLASGHFLFRRSREDAL